MDNSALTKQSAKIESNCGVCQKVVSSLESHDMSDVIRDISAMLLLSHGWGAGNMYDKCVIFQ